MARKETPLFSIITPTFNRAYILPSLLDSLISQTNSNFEHLIIDDGSTDGTESLIKSFNDPRFRYLEEEHHGPSAARNVGLDNAKGKWIVYIDSDNELLPNYLEVMSKYLNSNPKATYALPKGNRTLELFEGRKLIKKIDDSSDFPDDLSVKDVFMRRLHFDCNGFVHSRKFIEQGLRWDETMWIMEDWDFGMTIMENDPDGFLYVPEVLFNYHQRYGGDGIVSNVKYKEWAEAFSRIFKKHQGSALLEGQQWYPQRVLHYQKLEEDYQAGKTPPPYLKLFATDS